MPLPNSGDEPLSGMMLPRRDARKVVGASVSVGVSRLEAEVSPSMAASRRELARSAEEKAQAQARQTRPRKRVRVVHTRDSKQTFSKFKVLQMFGVNAEELSTAHYTGQMGDSDHRDPRGEVQPFTLRFRDPAGADLFAAHKSRELRSWQPALLMVPVVAELALLACRGVDAAMYVPHFGVGGLLLLWYLLLWLAGRGGDLAGSEGMWKWCLARDVVVVAVVGVMCATTFADKCGSAVMCAGDGGTPSNLERVLFFVLLYLVALPVLTSQAWHLAGASVILSAAVSLSVLSFETEELAKVALVYVAVLYASYSMDRSRRLTFVIQRLMEESSDNSTKTLSFICHELRNPVSGIVGTAELLVETDLDVEQAEYVQDMYASCEQLRNVVNDVLDLTKIGYNKMQIDAVTFKPLQLAKTAVSQIKARAGQKNIDLRFLVQPSVPEMLQCDSSRLLQCCTNYLSNAVKFTPHGGKVVLAVEVEQLLNNKRVLLRFSVTDTGPGIAEADMGKLFQSFSQTSSSIARRHGGTGLGLTIVKELVNLMEGEVGCESDVGQGSTFWFNVVTRLPTSEEVVDAELAAQIASPDGAPSADQDMRGGDGGARAPFEADALVGGDVHQYESESGSAHEASSDVGLLSPGVVRDYSARAHATPSAMSLSSFTTATPTADALRTTVTPQHRAVHLAPLPGVPSIAGGGGKSTVGDNGAARLGTVAATSPGGAAGSTSDSAAAAGLPPGSRIVRPQGSLEPGSNEESKGLQMEIVLPSTRLTQFDVSDADVDASRSRAGSDADDGFDSPRSARSNVSDAATNGTRGDDYGDSNSGVFRPTGPADGAVVGRAEKPGSVTSTSTAAVSGSGTSSTSGGGVRSASAASGRMPPLRTLVVDDELVLRKWLSRMLGKKKLSVATATEGGEALEMIQRARELADKAAAPDATAADVEASRASPPFDFITMDIQMAPGVCGVDATNSIRAWEQSSKSPPALIIAVTSNTDTPDRIAYQAAGMDGVIAKPVNMQKLAATVRALCRRRRVLAVDDQDINLRLISRALSAQGHIVDTAKTSSEALRKLRERAELRDPFELVLLDLSLDSGTTVATFAAGRRPAAPAEGAGEDVDVADGMQVLKMIRALPDEAGTVPVVAVSGSPERARECLAAGCAGFVAKPFDRRQLVAAVHDFSRSRMANVRDNMVAVPLTPAGKSSAAKLSGTPTHTMSGDSEA